jgi:hypothetical protein
VEVGLIDDLVLRDLSEPGDQGRGVGALELVDFLKGLQERRLEDVARFELRPQRRPQPPRAKGRLPDRR